MTDKTKRRSLLAGTIIFWSLVLAMLILTTTRNASADETVRIQLPDGTVVDGTIMRETDPMQELYDMANGLTAGEGNYVKDIYGYEVWIPRQPYGPQRYNRQ